MSTREEYVLSRVSQSLFDASETVRLYLTESQTPLPGFEQLFSLLMQADIQRRLLAFRDFQRVEAALAAGRIKEEQKTRG